MLIVTVRCSPNCISCIKNGAGKCDACLPHFNLLWDSITCTPCPLSPVNTVLYNTITRCMWGTALYKRAPTVITTTPVPAVVIHHTFTAPCSSISTCSKEVKDIQTLMMGPTNSKFCQTTFFNEHVQFVGDVLPGFII